MEQFSPSHKCEPAKLQEVPSGKHDLVLRVCEECGRRHFELSVDPGKFGLKF